MKARNQLLSAPPFEVEQALRRLGANLRTARLRRRLTLEEVAQKLGVHRHVLAAVERGKPSTGIGIYAGLLWVLGLVDQLGVVAAPEADAEGTALARAREPGRAHPTGGLDSDF